MRMQKQVDELQKKVEKISEIVEGFLEKYPTAVEVRIELERVKGQRWFIVFVSVFSTIGALVLLGIFVSK